jgi:hypothetical protein
MHYICIYGCMAIAGVACMFGFSVGVLTLAAIKSLSQATLKDKSWREVGH